MVGATDLRSKPDRSGEKDFKGSGSESSFGKALEEKISSQSPKEVKDSPQKEMRRKDDTEKPQKQEAKEAGTEVAKPDGKITKKATDRQQAIQEFMDSFESEFEIPPTRLVEAMAQLDDEQLTQSPETTADAVVDQLNLSDADADKARAMYAALLIQLSQAQTPAKKEIVVGGGAAVSNTQVQARALALQEKQSAMGASVDRLNKNFMARPEAKALEAQVIPKDGAWAQKLAMEKSMQDGLPWELESDMDVPMSEMPDEAVPSEGKMNPTPSPASQLAQLPPHLQGQMKEVMSPALLAALAAKHAAQAQQAEGMSEEAPALMDEFQQALQGPKLEAPILQSAPQGPGQQKMAQEFFQNQSQGQSLMQQNGQQFAQKGMSEGANAKGGEVVSEKSLDFKNSLSGLEGLHGAPIKGETLKAEMTAPMVAAAPTAPANPAENEAAVKQLMNQAQYLIKKGGGEMKVQMTPEGMGTIHLKVMLQDGKVNMQMSADTQEAKKTIESSLAELKTSLAAHKLSMENVKVDVVGAASTDTAAQNQTDLTGQNQRDQNQQTRQFWNQFNDNFGSQGRKESFMEMPNLRGYGAKTRDPMQPIEVKSQARKVEGKGSGLNLVA
ncbi:MAG: flagellar hook-length control protein FliK [Bdellovibrio sp.]|nr:flagellar hook-length control protein FliK [Bdellovibrio sp.]